MNGEVALARKEVVRLRAKDMMFGRWFGGGVGVGQEEEVWRWWEEGEGRKCGASVSAV